MMKNSMIRLKRFLTLIVLAVFIALGARAQEDEDIAHSLNLTEVVVLADGMTFEEYLLKQVLEHAKPLKDRTKSLKYTVTCQVEKDMDLNKFPHRRTITFAARLAGYGPIVSALREHKHFGITVAEDVVFQNGKMMTSKARMVEMKQKLTDKQIASSKWCVTRRRTCRRCARRKGTMWISDILAAILLARGRSTS